MKRADAPGPARLVWADPLERLAGEMEAEAAALRSMDAGNRIAGVLEVCARRTRERMDIARAEWVPTDAAALLLDIAPGSVAARCRRVLEKRGQARKVGALWYVHASALQGQARAA